MKLLSPSPQHPLLSQKSSLQKSPEELLEYDVREVDVRKWWQQRLDEMDLYQLLMDAFGGRR